MSTFNGAEIKVEAVPRPGGWSAIVYGGTEPYTLRLPDGYDPREDHGRLIAEMVADVLDRST